MSLQIAAQHLASKGRNGDSMLVHMTPNEVKGLQALAMAHGGSLSVNPETGLVEANFLESLLPTLIGAGLTFFSGGVINPVTAGMIVGGIQTARTGDLGKGIMAGLGAYGGAGLGSSLAATGSQVAENTAMMNAVNQVPAGATGAFDIAGAANTIPASSIGTEAGTQAILDAQKNAAADFANKGAFDRLGSSLSASIQNPGMFTSNLGATFPTMTEKAAAAYPTVAALSAPKPITPIEPEKSNYAGPYVPQARTVRYPTDRDPNDSSEFTFFSPMNPYPGFRTAADGGLMNLAKGSGLDMADGSFVMSAREVAEVGNGSSNAGLERLSKMGAQPIRGKGDGVSDSIKANIGGSQEARVARDEAYFPPEAVKRIGDGNPKKGAKKLYALMSAAEKARKKAPRGEDSGLHRLMPA